MTHGISNIKKVDVNNKYLFDETKEEETFNYNLFTTHNTIIIKSCTGTGKTTAVAKHVSRCISENKEINLLTITNKIALSDQHFKSFGNEKINIIHYRDLKAQYDTEAEAALTICINSLRKFLALDKDELSHYIVYIDEITSFLNLTHNDTLSHDLKLIFNYLMNISKYCYKFIISDAILKDCIFDILRHRDQTNFIYIENHFKKYQNIEAVKIDYKIQLISKLKDKCKKTEYFLCGGDSRTEIMNLYLSCIEANQDEKDKLLLIDKDTK